MWIPFILISAFFLSLYDVSKKKSVHENAVMPVLFLATLFGAISYVSLLLVQGECMRCLAISGLAFVRVLFKSLLVAASWIFAYYAMRSLPFSIVSPIRSSAPFWTLLGALALYHEIPSFSQALGMGCVLAGYWGFSQIGQREGIHFTRNLGILYAFAGTLLGACSALYDKYLLQTCAMDKEMMQLWFELDLVILIGIGLLVQRVSGLQRTRFQWRWSIPLVGVLLVAADAFYFAALSERGVAISILSLIRRSNVAFSFLLGAALFGEKNLKKKAFALTGILIGIVLMLYA